ncbi:MAG: FHA domain-containing protein, partial [Pseudomonadota bacterium]
TDQTITLDFGDQAISRSNHAAIVYEPETYKFHLGHGGKANIVRVNGKPVVSTEELLDGSTIEIGDTTLGFVALCSDEFNWSAEEAADDDDAAFL